MKNLSTKPLFRPDEVADLFEIHIRTVYRLCDKGDLDNIKIGGKTIRIKRDSIIKIMDQATE
jgi:excisionase family DNA binding protein